jgi:hypothetical protein
MNIPIPALIDIPHPGTWRRFRWARVFIMLLIICSILSVGTAAIFFLKAYPIAPVWVVPFSIWLLMAGSAVSWSILSRKRMRRRAAAIVDQHRADPGAAMRAVLPTLVYRYIIIGMNETAKRIRAAGHCGLVLRVGPPTSLIPIDPLCVEFEPLPLNETDPAFLALRASGTTPHDPDAAAPPTRPDTIAPANDDHSPMMRSLRRASRLGRTRLWIIFGFMFVMAAIDAFDRRQITTRLVIWGVALASSLIGPTVLAAERGLRFLLLPSSLLWRQGGFRKAAYKLHLFERERSLLCVYHFRRSTWVWTVADETKQIFSLATRDEITMLLRGWLSPLPPPPLSRLSEFAGS